SYHRTFMPGWNPYTGGVNRPDDHDMQPAQALGGLETMRGQTGKTDRLDSRLPTPTDTVHIGETGYQTQSSGGSAKNPLLLDPRKHRCESALVILHRPGNGLPVGLSSFKFHVRRGHLR